MVKILLNCFLKNSDGKNFTQLLFEKTVMVKILLNCFLKNSEIFLPTSVMVF